MGSTAVDKRLALRRSIVIWSGILLLTIAALFSAVGILNRELYSAPAFVRIYLDALANHDVAAALATPGVTIATNDSAGAPSTELVTPDALGGLSDATLVSDTELSPGRHRVVYAYTLTGLDDHAVRTQTEFDVRQTGTGWFLFPQWTFVSPPTATVSVTVSHAASFRSGTAEVTLPDPASFHSSAEFDVLVPGLYVLSHSSAYLGSRSVAVTASASGARLSAVVDVQPTYAFVDAVKNKLDAFLDQCTTERLLYPPGCPFGLDIDDRITTEPSWSIETYPTPFTIIAGQDSWIVPNSSGLAHVTVDVRSLFDGTVSTIDKSVLYNVSFSLTIEPDGSIRFGSRG